jgi:hypothetical protein
MSIQELGSLALCAAKAHVRAHELGELLGDGESDTGPLDGARLLSCAVERLEDPVLLVVCDPDPVVRQRDADRTALRRRAKGRRAAPPPVLDRVGSIVQQDLLEAGAVGHDPRQLWRERSDLNRHPGSLGHRIQRALHLGEDLGQPHRFERERHTAGLDAREVEDLVDEAEEMLATLDDVLDPLLVPLGRARVGRQRRR